MDGIRIIYLRDIRYSSENGNQHDEKRPCAAELTNDNGRKSKRECGDLIYKYIQIH